MLQFDTRRGLLLDQLEQVTFSPNIVTLSVEVFAGRFPFLLTQLLLLILDPSQLGDGKHADGVEVHA